MKLGIFQEVIIMVSKEEREKNLLKTIKTIDNLIRQYFPNVDDMSKEEQIALAHRISERVIELAKKRETA